MFAGEWSVLQKPNNRVVGPSGVLEGGTGGAAVVSPTALAGTEAWYDIQDPSSMVIDGSNRVSLVADKSGNSAENCLILPGVAGNYASAPDSAAVSPTTSFDIDVGVALSDWTPSTTQALLGKDDTASERSFLLFITATTGVPVCNVFDSAGTSFGFVCSTAPTVADRQLLYLRAKITWALAGNCLCDFFTSTDGVSWSALGTQQSVAATGNAIKDSTVAFSIGQRVSGSNQLPSTGIFYRARLYSGDRDSGGTLAFDADFTAQSKLATSFTESSSNAATVTINQTAIALPARIHGARDRYQGVAANQPTYLPYGGEKYGWFNGVSGNYASAPSVSATATSLDVKWNGTMDDWSPASDSVLIGRSTATGNQRSWFLRATTSGQLLLSLSQDGISTTTATSSAATGFTNGTRQWIRATWRASDGRVQFFTGGSDVAPSWSQLGSDQSIALASILNSSAPITISGLNLGTLQPFAGTCYASTVSHTIDGDPVTSFNAEDYTSGRTLNDSAPQAEMLSGSLAAGSNPPDTLSVDGLSVLSCIDDGGDVGLVVSGTFTLVSGQRYKVTIPDFVLNSGTYPELKTGSDIALTTSGGLNKTSYLGESEIYFTATASGTHRIGWRLPSIATNFSHGDLSLEAAPQWTLNGGSVIVDRTQLFYDGSNDEMRTAPFPLEQPESVYFAGSQVTWTDLDYIYDGGNITDMAFRQQNASGRIYLQAGSLGPYITAGIGENFVAASVFNGASSSNRLNLETAVTGNAGTNAADAFIIGGRGSPFGNYANITETGVIIRSTADDAATQARFIRYLAQKGGISV